MIRHIVSWKLKAADEPGKALAAAEITAALTSLPGAIAEIQALTVAGNAANHDKNHDIVLIVDLESLEDLEAYQVHPAHIRAGGVIGPRVSARACVDFEVV